jgi:hypothetical protein
MSMAHVEDKKMARLLTLPEEDEVDMEPVSRNL